MKRRNFLYGSMSLLSVLGLIGVFTEQRNFLAFFAFVVDFKYFFIPFDEMLEAYMNKSAARAFYCGMLTTAATALISFLLQEQGSQALLIGFSWGWAVSIIVYALSTAVYSAKEDWELSND